MEGYIKRKVIEFLNIQKTQAENLNYYFSHLILLYEKLISLDTNLYEEENKDYQVSENKLVKSTQLHWKRDGTSLIELIIALLESNCLICHDNRKPSQKEAIAFFQAVFRTDIKDPSGTLHRAVNRKKDVVPFLRELLDTFKKYSGKADF